ncbi:hypothetical protein [Micromonospora sp. IBHARD004]|uniref:hypothetical protein n=1 Tax=Micromonospora sp. IBHARD004 TaxID=3457764 RepID=UPI00405A4331
MEKGERTGLLSVSREEAAVAVADDPTVYEEVSRRSATMIFVGLRVDLAKISEQRLLELVEHAWRNKAPRRLVAAHDAR